MVIIVRAHGVNYPCHRARKGIDFIRLCDENGVVIAEFNGITDFSAYTIEGGEWEPMPPTDNERLDALEAAMLETILMLMEV